MGERGVTMDTVQWGKGVLPWRRYSGGERCYHGHSTVGKRVHSTVGKCYYGDSRVGERIVTMDTVQ